MFIDEVRIFVKAGGGGKGCESFYRDLYTRYPRPDGGDGGKGGDVVFLADQNLHTLLDYRFKQHYEGKRGGHASSKGKKGRTGADCILRVPVGTILRDADTKLLIRDLSVDGQSLIVAKGGRGGRGNAGNRTPTLPEKGEERTIHLELKLIADVGLIGFPNVGKSTIISNISKVRSKIANYPFTTKQPILGVVHSEDLNFIVADLPGLIEGAHEGKGLGDRFLKHAERTKVLVHVLDMAGMEGRDPRKDYQIISEELEQYSDEISVKKRLVVANKMDVPEAAANLKKFKKKFPGEIIEISALQKQGLEELVEKIKEQLRSS
ncbi:MAG: GTPase ObgE [Candidatus Omnitrophica bacterium]|nr:GTPase ObgE [Candidatus Omnitrophota bacterium]